MLFRQPHRNFAAPRRKFNGIGSNIDKYLIDPQRVANQTLLTDVVCNDFETDAFFFGLRLN